MTKSSYKGTYTVYPKQLSNGEKSLYIAEIYANKKGCGYGRQLLEDIFKYAKRNKLSICLHANADFYSDSNGLNQIELEDWYFRNGFNLCPDLDPDSSTNFFYKDR